MALRRCQFHRLTLTILEANQLDPVKNMFRHDLGLLEVTLEYGSRTKRPQKLFLQVWSLADNRSPFSKTVWKLTVGTSMGEVPALYYQWCLSVQRPARL